MAPEMFDRVQTGECGGWEAATGLSNCIPDFVMYVGIIYYNYLIFL
ncbi:MAG: hypothetical protein K5780_01055 [Alphaproteobacteria bacterium]|nr:hypothetical protein [Alphaproteobacteria bacterium]